MYKENYYDKSKFNKRYDKYMDTHVINAYDRCVFEFAAENPAASL